MTVEYLRAPTPGPNEMPKRFRSSDFAGNPRTLRPTGGYGSGRTGAKRRRVNKLGTKLAKRALSGIARLTRMIETKEAQRVGPLNGALGHNNVEVIADSSGGYLNPFSIGNGTGDPMSQGTGNRIGDSIAVKGLTIKAFFENALGRARVYYRLMLIKCAKTDVPTRAVLFKNDSNNKMMDVINTERFTVVAQRTFTINTSNAAPATVGATGVPATATPAGLGTKLVTMWIPGRKFGRSGVLQYESESSQLKFFDYCLAVVAYDWYGTPQDVNNVGRINEIFTKVYFKDA